jgi:hypothetical protein
MLQRDWRGPVSALQNWRSLAGLGRRMHAPLAARQTDQRLLRFALHRASGLREICSAQSLHNDGEDLAPARWQRVGISTERNRKRIRTLRGIGESGKRKNIPVEGEQLGRAHRRGEQSAPEDALCESQACHEVVVRILTGISSGPRTRSLLSASRAEFSLPRTGGKGCKTHSK